VRVGVATLAAGRAEHLRRQARAVARLTGVARYVVVDMDGDGAGPGSRPGPGGAALAALPRAQVIRLASCAEAGLPLAAARNRAIEALTDCDLAIMLDVDCLPSARLLTSYRAAATTLGDRPALLCGPVGYLDALDPDEPFPGPAARRRARQRVIRSFPARGVRRESRHELFWSLSFAVRPAVHAGLGGFDEGYVGYGAEDTDYGLRAREAGVGLWFVGGAWAYHQPHPPTPPRDLASLVANARRFRDRWGFWPMPDRLAAFAREGRIDWAPDGARCVVLD
jgi:N-acetylglucosaminyl-diphospho-decaprenol L-rhamnosyltransferase